MANELETNIGDTSMLKKSEYPALLWSKNLENELKQSSSISSKKQDKSRFKSTRRILRILELVSQQEGLTTKFLAPELGISLSNCYNLVKILIEEGYLEKIPKQRGYKLGPAISLLHKRASTVGIDSTVEPVIKELAEQSERQTYFAVYEDNATEVTEI